MPEPDLREQQERAEKQIHELTTQVRFLEDEIALLRRRLTNAPRQVKILEEKLVEARSDLSRALSQNEKLATTLRAEKDRIETLREDVEKLSQPPASFGVFLGVQRRRLGRRLHRRTQDAGERLARARSRRRSSRAPR